ncbi:hypothetical protein D3C75_1130730 [compost metagenome]
MFFTETKITITKNEKVWGHIFIKQKPLDYKLTFSFKIDKEINLNKNNFLYEHYIESVDIKSNSVKFLLNDSMPSNFFNKCI